MSEPMVDIPIKTSIIGLGGGGGNIVSEYAEYREKHLLKFPKTIKLIAANTDSIALKPLHKKVKKIILGDGIGAGLDPDKGRAAFLDKRHIVLEAIGDPECVITVATLGGGTGGGSGVFF